MMSKSFQKTTGRLFFSDVVGMHFSHLLLQRTDLHAVHLTVPSMGSVEILAYMVAYGGWMAPLCANHMLYCAPHQIFQQP